MLGKGAALPSECTTDPGCRRVSDMVPPNHTWGPNRRKTFVLLDDYFTPPSVVSSVWPAVRRALAGKTWKCLDKSKKMHRGRGASERFPS